MIPVSHGFLCVCAAEKEHWANPAWRPGWGATRAEAIANARYPEGWRWTREARRGKAWVFARVTPEVDRARVKKILEGLPVERRRFGRFRYALDGVFDLAATLAPRLRELVGRENELLLDELPGRVRGRVREEISYLGLVWEQLVALQVRSEFEEGTAEERFERVIEWTQGPENNNDK